jgi:ribosomal protein S18 acetylase RimI-like enzyme
MEEATLRATQGLAQELWRRQPALVNADATVGELAWVWGAQHGASASEWSQRLWSDAGKTVAWGWIFAPSTTTLSATTTRAEPTTLAWQVHPDRPDLLDSVLDWFETEAPDVVRQTSARQADEGALERLRRHGYEHDPDAPWGLLNMRELRDIEEPRLPPGYRLKTMREVADVSLRVAVHRAAWEPSSVTETSYADVMNTWPYRDDLDFVVEASDGSLAASALGWYDEENRVGEFEPVGTHPDHRRRGLGRAVNLFGLRRFHEAGAVRAIVGCRGDAAYPIPKLLYESVGFRQLTRELRFIKR